MMYFENFIFGSLSWSRCEANLNSLVLGGGNFRSWMGAHRYRICRAMVCCGWWHM